MLTWDAISKAQKLPTSTPGSTTICDDLASDLDLFEIENISVSPLLTVLQVISSQEMQQKEHP